MTPRGMARQYCMLHGCHQDDPGHDYQYPACEQNLRASTRREDFRCWLRIAAGWRRGSGKEEKTPL